MSDKVKLIIEIPKYYWTHPQDYSCLAECVRRGIPLEQIRAEIEGLMSHDDYMVDGFNVLDIIDKYTKGGKE